MFHHSRVIKPSAITLAHVLVFDRANGRVRHRATRTRVEIIWFLHPYVRLCSLGQHFVGPSGYCGMTTRIELLILAVFFSKASRMVTHSTMMEPSTVGSACVLGFSSENSAIRMA